MTTSAATTRFTPELFRFLSELKRNNRREWFESQRERYERAVRVPALAFIAGFEPHLRRVSPQFLADPRPVGGSLFRIHRDVRFGKDKSPYKTHVGIRFPHRSRGDVHAPGFYLHLEPGACFAGIGIWHPDPATLEKIRRTLAEQPAAWRRTLAAARFKRSWQQGGESLARPPRGYAADHPLVEDLKRKDFIASVRLPDDEVTRAGFTGRLAARYADGAGFVRFLCGALGLGF